MNIEDIVELTAAPVQLYFIYDTCGLLGLCDQCKSTSRQGCGKLYPFAEVDKAECYSAIVQGGTVVYLTFTEYTALLEEHFEKFHESAYEEERRERRRLYDRSEDSGSAGQPGDTETGA